MPSSRACTIPIVIDVVGRVEPQSILDVGVGFGKWGYLLREYTDIRMSESEPERYAKANWRIEINGIEGYKSYIHEAHAFAYDEIFIGDARDLIDQVGTYDTIIFGDIIEHFTMEEGEILISRALSVARKCVIITTPLYETHQEGSCGNELETHRSLWAPDDFRRQGKCFVRLADYRTQVCIFWKDKAPKELYSIPGYPTNFSGYVAEFAFRARRKLRRSLSRTGRLFINNE